MGLDMHLTGEKYQWTDYNNPENNPMEDGFRVKSRQLELGYWRKHPNLHGYIVQEFAGGVDECQSSDSDDQNSVEQLEAAIKWLRTDEKGIFRSVSYRASW